MTVISLKDYAKTHHISYEAVRKQVARYKKDLEGHLIKDGRQQFLDEEAVAFLDAKRAKNPVAIINISKDEALEAVKGKYTSLLEAHTALQAKMDELQQENYRLASENAKIALLEADNEAARLKVQETEKIAQKTAQELTEARAEIDAMRNATLWERIRGWKKKG